MMAAILTDAMTFPLSETSRLPEPSEAERAHSSALLEHIGRALDATGFLPFDRFMEAALYTPGLGYYASGVQKLGAGGDFMTAPEWTRLFGQALSAPLAHCIEAGMDTVVELGPGSGVLAADLLLALERRACLPRRYLLLELSAELQVRQRATLAVEAPHLLESVQWIDRLPESIDGIVLGNEVLDAAPVSLIRRERGEIRELGVVRAADPGTLAWAERPAEGALRTVAEQLALPDGYTTEIHLHAQGLVRSLGDALQRGLLLFLDYGFPAHEYYHPQRSGGTLVCHYRHRVHGDPLTRIGLQDITSHLDFSALAAAAGESGLQLLGFTTQAHFLLDCGILDALGALGSSDSVHYAKAASAVQKLLAPSEMGELVKAIAFGRGIEGLLPGFRSGDMRRRL
jgi:SAM-dependent MidA family methyltransferase